MKYGKRIFAGFLACSVIATMAGCSKTTNETTAEDTESPAVETEETTVEEETTTEDEETTDTTESEETVDYSDLTTYCNNCVMDAEEQNKAYDLYRDFVSELDTEFSGRLYGFYRKGLNDEEAWEYTLLIYDGTSYTNYHVEGDKVVQTALDKHGISSELDNPERVLLSYVNFMDYPGLNDFTFFWDPYEDIEDTPIDYTFDLKDGACLGTLYGFDEDITYAYAAIGHAIEVDKSADECAKLQTGDTVKLDGKEFKVNDVLDVSEYDGLGGTVIYLHDSENSEYIIVVYFDDNGNADHINVFDNVANPTCGNMKMVKIPVSPDCVIDVEVYNYLEDEFNGTREIRRVTIDEFKELMDWGSINTCDPVHFENGGYTFNGGTPIGYVSKSEIYEPTYIQVENNEITYLNLSLYYEW